MLGVNLAKGGEGSPKAALCAAIVKQKIKKINNKINSKKS